MYRPRVLALSLCVSLLLSLTAPAQTRAARDGDEPVGDVRLDVPGKSVPRLVKFSGTLRDGAGQVMSGTRSVTFAIYGEQGSKQALWQEVQNVVADESGRYTVTLGATLPGGIPIEMFANGEARWLETRTSADGDRAQRLMLVSVPFALKAEDADKLGGRSASEFVLTSEIEQQVAKAVAERQAKQGTAKEGGQAFLAPDKPIGTTVQDIAPNGAARFQDASVVEVVLVQQNGASGFGLKAVAIGGSAIQAQSQGVGSGNATILAQAVATTGAPVAIQGESFGQTGIGVQGIATSPSATSNVGVRGEAAGTAGRGVVGMATAASGATYGVLGAAGSDSGAGVRGEANGVSGGTGVIGIAGSNTGNTIGVHGEVSSSSGTAGLFRSNNSGGKVLLGQGPGTTDVFTVDAGGNVTASGIVTATGGLTTSGMLNVGNLNVPSTSSASGLVKATNSGTGPAVEGLAAGANNVGVYGRSISGNGVGVLGESNTSGGTAGMFNNTAGGKIISGQSNFVEVFSVKSPANTTNAAVVHAIQTGSMVANPDPANLAPTAVRGEATATTGFSHGVLGLVNSPDGVGVLGGSLSTGAGGTGVLGVTLSTSGDAAVAGESLATTGNTKALKGTINSSSGTALQLEGPDTSSSLIRGAVGPEGSRVEVFQVDGTGTITALGALLIGPNGGGIGRDTINDGGVRVGFQGIADSNNGRGVIGSAPTTGTGNSIGVFGQANADNSAGVLGRANSATGTTSGVRGINFSSGGHAVRGDNYPPTANAVTTTGIGVLGTYGQNANFTTNTSASGGFGVWGRNFATNGFGVAGEASGVGGIGVQADATNTTGFGRGVRGNVYSSAGMGVEGVAQNASGTGIGVSGLTNAANGVGVRGEATLATGVAGSFLNTAGTAGSATLINAIGDGGAQKFVVNSAGAVTAAGIIHSTSGGIKFPDNTVQTTAAGAGTGVSTNTANALVQRDGTGRFAAQNISLDGALGIATNTTEAVMASGLQRITGINPNETVLWFTDALRIKSGSTGVAGDKLSVLTNGNVGIGTPTPAERLVISDPAGSSMMFQPAFSALFSACLICGPSTGGGHLSLSGGDALQAGGNVWLGGQQRADANVNAVIFYQGLNERMRIQDGGNVGIGTATPSTALQVAGTVTATAFVGDGSALTGIVASNTASLGGVAAANYARNDAGNTFAGTQVFSGAIGMGTASPSEAFHMSRPTGAATILLDSGNDSDGAKLSLIGGSTSTRWDITTQTDYLANALVFRSNGFPGNPRMVITPGGEVGIGTSAPATKLDLNGFQTLRTGASLGNWNEGLSVQRDNTSSAAGVFWHTGTGTPNATSAQFTLQLEPFLATNDLWLINNGMTGSALGRADAVMRVNKSTGAVAFGANVGIGTATPSSALQVAGTVTATSFVGDGGGLANVVATSATNASQLGGVAAANYARLDVGNAFTNTNTFSSNVGVGNAGPQALFHVGPTTGAGLNDVRLLSARNDGSDNALLVDNTGSSANSVVQFFTVTGGEDSSIFLDEGDARKLKFSLGSNQTTRAGRSSDTRMTITQSGSVGIGTSSPSTALQVAGTVTATSFVGDGGGLANVVATSASNASQLGGVAAANYARNDQVNTFGSNQVINANTTTPTAGLDISQLGSGSALNVAAPGIGAFPAGATITATATDTVGATQSRAILALSNAPGGRGIQAVSQATTGAGIGMIGFSAGDTGTGISALATSATGATKGLRAWTASPSGVAGEFESDTTSGMILKGFGAGVLKFSVDALGNLAAGGSVTAASFSGSGAGLTGVSVSSPISLTTSNGTSPITAVDNATSGGTFAISAESSNASGTAVQGAATSATGFTIGVNGTSSSPDGTGVHGIASAATGNNAGVFGENNSVSGVGVKGNSYASSGTTAGVKGTASSPNGAGVLGVALGGGANIGVSGENTSTTGIAVSGFASSPLGSPIGVRGITVSPSGAAGSFQATGGGGLILQGIGDGSVQKFSVSSAGDVTATSFSGSGASLTSIPNSATTATTAATASTIALRDTAGDITATAFHGSGAALTGIVASSASALALPTTTSSSVGTITQNSAPFIHSFGTNSFFAGASAGNFALTGTQNVGVGPTALSALTSGGSNTAMGRRALQALTTGSFNTAVGTDALLNVTTTTDNTAVGWSAMLTTTTGSQNTAFGKSSLQSNTIGFENVGVGVNALFNNTDGFENTGIGTNGLRGVTTGDRNTAIGRNAGYTATPANATTTGNDNTFLGAYSGPGTATQLSNATAVGANALVNASNSLVLGNNANVGIGTSTPSEKLHVVGNILATGTITGNGSGMTNVATVAGSFTQAQPALTAIPVTTLTTPTAAGLYRASCYMVNTASATGPNGVASIYWTDDSGTAQTGVCATFSGGSLGVFSSGSVMVQSGASAITFDVTSHSSAYKVYISVEKLM